ncbi:MAG: nuclear transport factor 2 family protein [Sphingomonadales bacterium]|nr:MAG: nuclear transport factor 2 family protein [Sphingomonadales bacterium]TNF03273.1 MAG: nuclear transport factor 2 family protein [Sphingomonadales bacterium]
MTQEERFHAYMEAFNANDWPRLISHYAPDVRLVIGNGTELVGRDAIVNFYRKVKRETRRTIHIRGCFVDGTMLAAELESEFLAVMDAPDFAAHPMKEGDRYYINSFVLYEFSGDLYTSIRSASFIREYRPRSG